MCQVHYYETSFPLTSIPCHTSHTICISDTCYIPFAPFQEILPAYIPPDWKTLEQALQCASTCFEWLDTHIYMYMHAYYPLKWLSGLAQWHKWGSLVVRVKARIGPGGNAQNEDSEPGQVRRDLGKNTRVREGTWCAVGTGLETNTNLRKWGSNRDGSHRSRNLLTSPGLNYIASSLTETLIFTWSFHTNTGPWDLSFSKLFLTLSRSLSAFYYRWNHFISPITQINNRIGKQQQTTIIVLIMKVEKGPFLHHAYCRNPEKQGALKFTFNAEI